jgi:uncharacterized OB-fold protein
MTEGETKKRSAATIEAASVPPPKKAPPEGERTPFLLDFFPLQEPKQTRLSPFFDGLRRGRLTTTRCAKDGPVWPPRVACPICHMTELAWVDLPHRGHVYAFSAVLAGAPQGMEGDVPFVVGLIDLEGVSLRLFGRIVGKSWTECRVGMPVRFEPFDLPDGRVFYRFRTDDGA